jgi:hypothetical protein
MRKGLKFGNNFIGLGLKYRKRVMKINFHINTIKHTFIISLFRARVTEVAGFTSDVLSWQGEHVIFWDFEEGVKLESVIEFLRNIQLSSKLGDVHVFKSGNRDSYRAIDCEIVKLKDMVNVIRRTEGLDIAFLKWTMIRRAATIRLTPKLNEPIFYVLTLDGYYGKTYSRAHSEVLNKIWKIPLPDKMNDVKKFKWVQYETTNLAPTLEHQAHDDISEGF